LLDELTSAQISEWEAYDTIDPVGKAEWRNELAIASLISVVVNMAKDIYNDPKKGKPDYVTPDDFLIKWGESAEQKPEKQTQDEMLGALLGIARMQGTTDKIERK